MTIDMAIAPDPPPRDPIEAAYAAGQRQALLRVCERQIRKVTGASPEIAAAMAASLDDAQIEELLDAIAVRIGAQRKTAPGLPG